MTMFAIIDLPEWFLHGVRFSLGVVLIAFTMALFVAAPKCSRWRIPALLTGTVASFTELGFTFHATPRGWPITMVTIFMVCLFGLFVEGKHCMPCEGDDGNV